jgi:hypothetical protein
MSLMLAEVYDAFREAHVSEETARKAATAVANYERQFADVHSELRLHRWMLATILAGVVALVLKTFF